MANEYDEIKDQVGDEMMEAPAPTQMRGMKPSIITKGNVPQQPMEDEPIMESNFTNMQTPQPIMPRASNDRASVETMEEIAESIVNEKWEELMSSVGNIAIWKEKVQTDIRSIKQEIVRTEERFENLQRAILGRVEDYNKTMTSVGTEMKALEGVLERILQPLATNIKELSRITEELKKK
ncbi:MAG: hypothetical protein PHF86_09205 [Candidatus Nanoarchaeia archaeon]|nr:hypothetical protein [Candidatus Nanoarchaeia archaeon]